MITDDITLCQKALRRGDLVAFPTETVFGLGARSDSPVSINKIYELKKRPTNHPLIAHCADIETALAIAPAVPDYARELAYKLWPGPMTLVFKRAMSDSICDEATGGLDTIAVRVPSHKSAHELLTGLTFFVSAPSANRFGRVSPTSAQHVQEEFGDELLILDGEPCAVGLESTIISCIGDQPKILRAGAITAQDILRVTNYDLVGNENNANDVVVPGSLETHYAPSIEVVCVANEGEVKDNPKYLANQCAFLSLSEPVLDYKHEMFVHTYDEFAKELYNFFREAEKQQCSTIFVMRPEEEGIGIAINDRLTKASNKA